ncbi:MAG: hypothetical protein EAX96_19275 [Candidatus Lokiarchaeota archaeon]|nr:hypothetical protein [Candidatus Lokiarchaeota archaeon]
MTIIKKIALEERLNTKTDFFIIGIIWIIYLITFISLILLPDPQYGGIMVAVRFAFFFAIFPVGLTAGMIFDRNLVRNQINAKRNNLNDTKSEIKSKIITREDIYRILIISIITIFSLPWITAIFGLNLFIFPNPVHLGENHGYYGYLLVLFAVLNTKIIKYNKDSIYRDIIIFAFIFVASWGVVWMLDDFLIEQFQYNIFFYSPEDLYSILIGGKLDLFLLFLNVLIIMGSSILIYWVLWKLYYHKKIPIIQ